jgi:iron complex outermembrane receptor protein
MIRYAVLALALAGPQSVFAQQPFQEHVIVTAHAEEVPYQTLARTVVVLTHDDIRRLPAHSVADLLAYASSIDVRSRGPLGVQSDFAARGATFGQALVLVDGFRLNDAQSGHHNADIPVPVDEIDRIEILFGPGSSLYGADAFGGIINVITRRGGSRRDVSASGGQFGFAEVNADASGSRSGLDESVAFSGARSSGFEIDRDFRTITISSRTSLANGTRLWASYLDKDFGANGFYGPALSTESTNQTLVAVEGRAPSLGAWQGQWQTGYRTHGDVFLFDSTRPGVPNDHRSHTVEATGRLQRAFGDATHVTVGTELGADWIRSNNLRNHNLTRGSGFAELQQRIGSRAFVYPGLRVDGYSTFGGAVSPSLAATGWVGAAIKLRGSVGRAFRVPTFTERFYSDPNNLGTPTLTPEHAWSSEAGLDWVPGPGWTTGLAVFDRRERDTIDFVRPSTLVRWQAANIRRVHTQGVELSADRRIPDIGIISARYTYINASSDPLPLLSKYVLEFARHSLTLSASAGLPAGFEIGQRVDYKRRRDGREYWVVDSRLGRRIGPATIFVEGSNLLDTRYQEVLGVNMPGRWIRAGMTVAGRN